MTLIRATVRIQGMSNPVNRPDILPGSTAPEPGSALAEALEQAREHAIRVLSDGFAYDALTEDEFEWRLGQLSLASSPAEVRALIADLPTPGTITRAPEYAPAPPRSEERIRGIMSEVRRDGAWRLPQRLSVSAVMSSVRLDLRQAVIPAGCTIEVRAIMANVMIVVPPGLPVDFDVSPVMGSARNDSASVPAAFGAPLVHVRGSAFMAEVRVRMRESRYQR